MRSSYRVATGALADLAAEKEPLWVQQEYSIRRKAGPEGPARTWASAPQDYRSSEGVALIETAIVLPLLVVLMLNLTNFGIYLYSWVTVHNAARAAVQYQAYHGVVLGFPTAPSLSQLQCQLYQEVSALPNKGTGDPEACTWSNVSLRVCSNANGTSTCVGSDTPFTVPTDPEPATYRLYAVDVGYNFQQLFAGATIPIIVPLPAAIHGQAFMRSME